MDVREPILVQTPLELPARFGAELAAEIRRLCAGEPSEVQEIYRIWPCATGRRREIQKLSLPRIANSLNLKRGNLELTAICEPNRVTLELAYADRPDELLNAAAVQDYIPLSLYFAELDPHEAPIGRDDPQANHHAQSR